MEDKQDNKEQEKLDNLIDEAKIVFEKKMEHAKKVVMAQAKIDAVLSTIKIIYHMLWVAVLIKVLMY